MMLQVGRFQLEDETKPREKGLILFPAASPFPPFPPPPVCTLGRSNPLQTNYITRGLTSILYRPVERVEN